MHCISQGYPKREPQCRMSMFENRNRRGYECSEPESYLEIISCTFLYYVVCLKTFRWTNVCVAIATGMHRQFAACRSVLKICNCVINIIHVHYKRIKKKGYVF